MGGRGAGRGMSSVPGGEVSTLKVFGHGGHVVSPIGLSRGDMAKFQMQTVPMDRFVPTQAGIPRRGLTAYRKTGAKTIDTEPPRVLYAYTPKGHPAIHGKYVILSGHTRLAAAKLGGAKSTRVLVARLAWDSSKRAYAVVKGGA